MSYIRSTPQLAAFLVEGGTVFTHMAAQTRLAAARAAACDAMWGCRLRERWSLLGRQAQPSRRRPTWCCNTWLVPFSRTVAACGPPTPRGANRWHRPITASDMMLCLREPAYRRVPMGPCRHHSHTERSSPSACYHGLQSLVTPPRRTRSMSRGACALLLIGTFPWAAAGTSRRFSPPASSHGLLSLLTPPRRTCSMFSCADRGRHISR